MNIVCSKDELNENINIVSKAVSSRSTMPVLEGIYIKAEENGYLTFKASDMELSIESEMQAEVTDIGEIVVNAKIFGNIIKTLNSETVSIVINDKNNIVIKGGKAKFELPIIPASEFPEILPPQTQYRVKIKKEILKNMVNKTIFAVSSLDTRPVLTGCLLEIEGNFLKMVAVDGYRMAIRSAVVEEEFEKNRIIIPAKALNELTRILKDNDDEFVNISFGGNHALFEFDGCKMYTRLIDGEYINYESIISSDAEKEIECGVDEFYSAVARASLLLAGETAKSIRMRVEENNINISCESSSGSVDDNITVENSGFELTIGFNHRYLTDALRACDCENVNLKFKNSRSPLIITPTAAVNDDDESESESKSESGDAEEVEKNENEHSSDFLYLILPVRLNED